MTRLPTAADVRGILMADYNFIIPGQPVAKGRPRAAIHGHRIIAYTPGKTRQYERDAQIIIKAAMAGRPPLEGPVSVAIDAWFKRPKRKLKSPHHTSKPDADNVCKILFDSMNGIAFIDDSQVCQLVFNKMYGDNPRVHITMVGL